MSRLCILSLAITGLLGASLGIVSTAQGQIPYPYLAMSVRPDSPANTCANAPPPCEGAARVPTTGRYEFDVYRVTDFGDDSSDTVRLCLVWPAAWNFVSAELCEGSLVSGDPSVPGAQMEFAFQECFAGGAPFLRIVMDCPTPGSFAAACSPTVHGCWTDEWVEESYPLSCDVGDWCGRLPKHPCNWCSMSYRQAAGFDPANLELTLPPGQTWTEILYVWGDLGPDCGGAPECGEGYGRCFDGLRADVSWMTPSVAWPPGDGFRHIAYALHINTLGLAPGRHEGNILSSPGCSWCIENCMPVTLNVLDPAAVDATGPTRGARLDGPYPNPATDRIAYAITTSAPTRARVAIFDVAGRRVADLLDRDLTAGSHDFTWAVPGDDLPSGSYVLRLETGGSRQSRLIVLAR
jgi:hypothetical protein